MIAEININSHLWKGLRITFLGKNLLQLFFVRSSHYWTHGSTAGAWPMKITWQSDVDTWHKEMAVLGRQCWQLQWKRCKCAFQPHGGLQIYKCDTLSLTQSITKRRDPMFQVLCEGRAERLGFQQNEAVQTEQVIMQNQTQGRLHSLLLQVVNLEFVLIMEKGTEQSTSSGYSYTSANLQ